jgi:hypothetical protein
LKGGCLRKREAVLFEAALVWFLHSDFVALPRVHITIHRRMLLRLKQSTN